MKVLLIDDQRTKEFIKSVYGVTVSSVAKNYQEGVDQLTNHGPWDVLLLDHDLGSFDENGKELTGSSIMQFLQQNKQLLPKTVVFVTSNPAGLKHMEAILKDIENEK